MAVNEMRLGDLDALLESAGIFEAKVAARGCGKSILHLAKAWLWNEVNKAPTIDAVPVVRCKDCKRCKNTSNGLFCDHYLPTKRLEEVIFYGTTVLARVKPDDFCSYGERKDGEG